MEFSHLNKSPSLNQFYFLKMKNKGVMFVFVQYSRVINSYVCLFFSVLPKRENYTYLS